MAIKSGQFLHDANGFVVDRIQTGGVSSLNIPDETIYELGNFSSVAVIRDIPDLSFDIESFDVSTEVEALLTGTNGTTDSTGTTYNFNSSMPVDIVSPFKSAVGAFDIVQGIAVPYLSLESVTYRFGVKASSTQAYTLRGDSIFYVRGTPKRDELSLVNNTLIYSYSQTALPFVYSGVTQYVLSACVVNPSTHAYRRLFFGTDFTTSTTQITLLHDWFDDGYTKLRVVYGTSTANNYLSTVHQGVGVKPAAVRGKDIDVYVAASAATPVLGLWNGIQSVEVTRKVTLDADQELGNPFNVAYDYDVPEVSGTIAIRPANLTDLFDKIQQVANVPAGQIIGPFTSQPLPIEIRISDPDTGTVLKSLYVPDARFTIPSVQGRVQTKQEVTFNWKSDSGSLTVYKGTGP